MDFVRGMLDRWKSASEGFERDMNDFLVDFEKLINGTNASKTIQGSSTVTSIKPTSQTPHGEEEECEDGGRKYKVGETWSDEGECNLKVCHPRKVISVRKCPEWQAPTQCRQQNLFKSKKFPECCPSVICPVPAA